MVTIDSGIHAGTRSVLNAGITLSGATGVAAALLGLCVMAAHGFDGDGLRLGTQITWRFASFVFFAAVTAGPLCRLIPLDACKRLGRRQLVWSFCASYIVFLGSLVLPNSVGGVIHDDATAGMILFSLFGGLAVLVMAYAASRKAVARVGEKSRRALLSVSGSYFWLTYALTGLAHLSGPHRPDAFYGVSLSLMIIALLLRFADRFVAKLRGTSVIPSL